MKQLVALPETESRSLVRNEERDKRLIQFLGEEIEDAYSARRTQEEAWEEELRQYSAIPRTPYRDVPIENAPNIEIPLGAMNVDDIYARLEELIFGASPVATARAQQEHFQATAKDVQTWVNWMAANECQLRQAGDQVFLDDVQLGTGIFYCPWVESSRKTDLYRVTDAGPRLMAVDPKNFITPGGAGTDVQAMTWCAMRYYLSRAELAQRKKRRGWNTKGALTLARLDEMQQRRELFGKTFTNARLRDLYEFHDFYVQFDYDGDGEAEELLCVFERFSRTIMWLGYDPYDLRPFEPIRYQLQGYLFNGIGVMTLCRPFQEHVTEAFNNWAANVLLANCRELLARTGTFPEGRAVRFPGKVHELANIEDVKELKMSDEYSSAQAHIEMLIAMAQQRTGNNASQQQRPVSTSRTSSTTAMALIQQQNRRFTAAFDSARLGTTAAIRQCLYRYRERLLAGDSVAEENIRRVMKTEEATQRVVGWLRDPGFEEQVQVELTASSASINRDADRQNALALSNLFLNYYKEAIQGIAIAANPQTPEPVRAALGKVSDKAFELMDIVSRTFDLIARDPSIALVDLSDEYQMAERQIQSGEQQMRGTLNQLLGGSPANGQGGVGGTAQPLPNSGQGLL